MLDEFRELDERELGEFDCIGTKVSMTLSEFLKVLSEILKMKHAKKQPGSSRIMGKPFLKVFGLGHF